MSTLIADVKSQFSKASGVVGVSTSHFRTTSVQEQSYVVTFGTPCPKLLWYPSSRLLRRFLLCQVFLREVVQELTEL